MYTVKILSNAEFDKLPYKKVKTSLGCADPSTNIAYVRDTGYNDITKETIAHELDELIAKVSPHEEDGIRYKDLGGVFNSFGTGIKNAAGGVGNFAKNVGGGIMNLFGGGSQDPSGGGLSNMTKSFMNPNANPFQNSLVNTAAAAVPKAAAQPSMWQNISSGIGDTVKKLAAPTAISLAGNLFAPKVTPPDFSGITNDLRNQVNTGAAGGEFRSLGGTELRRILQEPIGTPPENAYTQGDQLIEDQLTKDLGNISKQYKAVRPGADVAGDSAYRKDIMEAQERARNTRAANRDALTFQYTQQQLQNKYNTMVQALNLDTSQLNQLVELAQLDIGQIMLRTGISAGEAQQMKQLFGDLGQLSAAKNFGLIGGQA